METRQRVGGRTDGEVRRADMGNGNELVKQAPSAPLLSLSLYLSLSVFAPSSAPPHSNEDARWGGGGGDQTSSAWHILVQTRCKHVGCVRVCG